MNTVSTIMDGGHWSVELDDAEAHCVEDHILPLIQLGVSPLAALMAAFAVHPEVFRAAPEFVGWCFYTFTGFPGV